MKARIYAKKVSYIISVSLGTGCYRHLRVSGNDTLDDLADSILWAFNFENDHLYSFFMDDKWWSDANAYHSPYGEEPPFADGVKLGRLMLEKGQKFKFIFDYGDEWRFQCKVLQVLDEETTDTEIVRAKGTAPEQYPNYDEEFDTETDDEICPASPITMTVNPDYQPESDSLPKIEIPDEVLEAAFQFRSDKLWKKICDNDFFAVRLSNGETGYCSVMGSGGQCIALALYIGDVGMWSIDQIFQDYNKSHFATLLTQNCLQIGLDNKSDLPDEMIEPVAAYAKAHGISFRGKNSYPNFLKFQSYLAPDAIKAKEDFGYLLEALRAAQDVSEKLLSVSKSDLGMDETFETMPLLTPKDGGFEWSQIPFPEIKAYPYPKPVVSAKRVEELRALPKKGTLESRVYILSDPTENEHQTLVFPPLLVAAGTPAKLKGTHRLNKYYPDCASELLEQFTLQMVQAGVCPKTILTSGERDIAFFTDFCKQCGIELKTAASLPKAEKVMQAYSQEDTSEGSTMYAISQLLTMVEQLSTEDLRDMPDELQKLLRSLMGTGMMSQSLERKLKQIL